MALITENISSIAVLLAVWLLLIVTMAVGWVYQCRVANAGFVDVFWTFGTGAACVVAALYPAGAAGTGYRQWLVAAIVVVWTLRLGIHMLLRVAPGPEDLRYVQFRTEWGADFQRRLFWFMQKQAYGSILFPLSIFVAAHQPAPFPRAADFIAALILAVAIGGEALADRQLNAFKSNPANKGRICDTGLWAWSRHPNYFFEWLGWFAYPVMAMDFTGIYPWGFLAFTAPALMYYVLLHYTGLPPLEAHMARSRGDAWLAYKAQTPSVLVPWPKVGP
jgi:steroid 5-alpha reductase family enzyme